MEPASPVSARSLRKRNRDTTTLQYISSSSEEDYLEIILDEHDDCVICSLCNKPFATKKLLDVHMAKHDKKKHTCKTCGKMLTSKVSLQQHMSVHSDNKNFMCEECGQCFRLKRFLRRHRLSHLPKTYKCDMCKRSFGLSVHLALHKKKHDEKKYKCDMCEERFDQIPDLDAHISVHDENEGDSEIDDAQGGRTYYPCNECTKSFKSSIWFNKHMQLHSIADESLAINKKLSETSSDRNKPIECNKCGNFFKTRSSLWIHTKSVHSDVKRFQCVVCERAFARKDYLEMHMLVHTGEKKYECEECGKSFTQKSSLNTHIKAHKRVHACPVCGIAFKKYNLLVQHMDEHQHLLDEKDQTKEQLLEQVSLKDSSDSTNLECPQCGKIYATRSSLTTHLKSVHSEEKKFQCAECNKTFARKCYLDVHKATHTGVKKYICEECGKSFAQKSTLNTHKNLHSSTHKCPECGKSFGRKSHVAHHVKQVHKEGKVNAQEVTEVDHCQGLVQNPGHVHTPGFVHIPGHIHTNELDSLPVKMQLSKNTPGHVHNLGHVTHPWT